MTVTKNPPKNTRFWKLSEIHQALAGATLLGLIVGFSAGFCVCEPWDDWNLPMSAHAGAAMTTAKLKLFDQLHQRVHGWDKP